MRASTFGWGAEPATSTPSTPREGGDGKDIPGSYYDAIPTAARDIQLCEHLPRLADRMDRCALLRTVSHDVNSQHGAASNLMHTGRKPSGTIIYPSVGSLVSHELGTKSDDVPSYVVMDTPTSCGIPGSWARVADMST